MGKIKYNPSANRSSMHYDSARVTLVTHLWVKEYGGEC